MLCPKCNINQIKNKNAKICSQCYLNRYKSEPKIIKSIIICPKCNINHIKKQNAKMCGKCYRDRFKMSDEIRFLAAKAATNRWANRPFNKISKTEKKKRVLLEQNGLCNICGIGQIWNNKLLVLQLDHIDGNNTNDARENLRVICPNCHTQTETFCSRSVSAEAKQRIINGAKLGAKVKHSKHNSFWLERACHSIAVLTPKIPIWKEPNHQKKWQAASVASSNHNSKVDVVCPHCGKEGRRLVMFRHHFDRCKFRS